MRHRALALAVSTSLLVVIWVVSASAQGILPQSSEPQAGVSPIDQASSILSSRSIEPIPVLDELAKSYLRRAIHSEQRIDTKRDRWRNPEASLQFFAVRPSDTVVEIWPGQGWYTSILGPYLKQGDGKLIVGHFDAESSNSNVVRQIVEAYRSRFAANPSVYGTVSVEPFGPKSSPLAPANSVDRVLTFRNIHNWMAQGWVEKAFADFFFVLKPGGILGIEEHRGRTDEPQDPLAKDGYVREDYVIQLAREAGFEFAGRSEINANPADTKDHPFGVWTLPPVSRTSMVGEPDDPSFDRRRYDAIGESDRMTLRFRKPLTATGVADPSLKMAADQVQITILPSPPPPPRSSRRGRRESFNQAPVVGAQSLPTTSQATPTNPTMERLAAEDKAQLASKPEIDKKSQNEKSQNEKPQSEKPQSEKPQSEKPQSEKPQSAISELDQRKPAFNQNVADQPIVTTKPITSPTTTVPAEGLQAPLQSNPAFVNQLGAESKSGTSTRAAGSRSKSSAPEDISEANSPDLPAPQFRSAEPSLPEIKPNQSGNTEILTTLSEQNLANAKPTHKDKLVEDLPTKSEPSTAKSQVKRDEPEAKSVSPRTRKEEVAKVKDRKKPKTKTFTQNQPPKKKAQLKQSKTKKIALAGKRSKTTSNKVSLGSKMSTKAERSKQKTGTKRPSTKKPDWKTPSKTKAKNKRST
ncbi:hypothetical protein [Candidatus Phycosocius spiralis]|uniref:Methyltransferase n=1 Tax=Candidatus Phycosocius spiralis TaxID=2815099 RepID=A0ABQ4PV69_9PROT|nr:hypothetical protein [Candidatus Phycosocius spiralis]GIU66603.1 hypothetical protein PsB1_0757 [Candidatus Phycosocius spiralis]